MAGATADAHSFVDRFGHLHTARVLQDWSPQLQRILGIRPVADAPHRSLTPELSEHSAVDGGGAVPQAGSKPVNDIKSHQGANQMKHKDKRHVPSKTKRTRPASAPAPISTGPTFISKANR
jgi:hypothetical protein